MFDLIPSGQPPTPDRESPSPVLLGRRGLAAALDLVVCYVVIESILLAPVIAVASEWAAANSGLVVFGSLVGLAPVYLTYAFALEWRFGQTVGKVWQGLVVTTVDGRHPGVVAAATRNLLRYVDFLPVGYLLGWLVARQSPTGQRVGDRVADTVVARARPPEDVIPA